MQRTAVVLLGALLISGSVVGTAAAAQHRHKQSGAYFGRDISEIRGSYNQVGPIDVAPRVLDRFDPSSPRNEGPVLNPPGS